MNKYILPIAFLVLLTACKDEKSKDESDSEAVEVQTKVEAPELNEIPTLRKCYTLINDTTDAELNLDLENDLVTGVLNYKGDNQQNGSVTGEFYGDTLILSYKYRENDGTIVKEMAFLEDKDNFTLQLGTAEMVEENNFKKIKDRSTINFDGPVFEKLDCSQDGE